MCAANLNKEQPSLMKADHLNGGGVEQRCRVPRQPISLPWKAWELRSLSANSPQGTSLRELEFLLFRLFCLLEQMFLQDRDSQLPANYAQLRQRVLVFEAQKKISQTLLCSFYFSQLPKIYYKSTMYPNPGTQPLIPCKLQFCQETEVRLTQ